MTKQQSEPPRTKADWRRRARANRESLVIDHDRVVAGLRHFLSSLNPQAGGVVVVTFSAMPGEPDLGTLAPLHGPWTLALTRTPASAADRVLTVHDGRGELERHPYGYMQPKVDAPPIADGDIGVVLVPGLAFGMDGSRLGHGAGYYDRFLARLGPGVIRVGVTDGFIVSGLPTDDHDVPMTHLAGEAGVFKLT